MKCKNCGRENSDEQVKCEFCGAELKDNANYVICPDCENKTPVDEKYCRKCGANIKAILDNFERYNNDTTEQDDILEQEESEIVPTPAPSSASTTAPTPAPAQSLQKDIVSKKRSKMQTWEYYTIVRRRAWNIGVFDRGPKEWNPKIQLSKLGEEGWELVSIVPRSATPTDFQAGCTDEELWVFKRPMN